MTVYSPITLSKFAYSPACLRFMDERLETIVGMRMAEQCRKEGHSPILPVLAPKDGWDGSGTRQGEVLRCLHAGHTSAAQIATVLGIRKELVSHALKKMMAKGIVARRKGAESHNFILLGVQ